MLEKGLITEEEFLEYKSELKVSVKSSSFNTEKESINNQDTKKEDTNNQQSIKDTEIILKNKLEEDGYSFLSKTVVRKDGTWDDYNYYIDSNELKLSKYNKVIKIYTL